MPCNWAPLDWLGGRRRFGATQAFVHVFNHIEMTQDKEFLIRASCVAPTARDMIEVLGSS